MNGEVDIQHVILFTKRLTIRPFWDGDLEDFYAYAKEEGVGEMAGWKHHESLEESKAILNLFQQSHSTFALSYKRHVIGSIGLDAYDEEALPMLDKGKYRELGFVLAKPYWGQGMMVEAVNAVLTYLFEKTDLDGVVCGYWLKNDRSRRVQEKLGFKPLCQYNRQSRLGDWRMTQMNIMYKRGKNE